MESNTWVTLSELVNMEAAGLVEAPLHVRCVSWLRKGYSDSGPNFFFSA